MNDTPQNTDEVAILLATYNGACFLTEQLASYNRQTHTNWRLWVSDDQSQDNTQAILQAFQASQPANKVQLFTGKAIGFVENFLCVTRHALGQANYYAWSDQDDIWHDDKLERALSWLKKIPANIPALYCGRTFLVDANNVEIGFSPLFKKKPSFANALTQNIGGGNTMVFNQAAAELIVNTSQNIPLVSHDWWAYIIVSGAGGRVFYDSSPCLRYRQHKNNLVGANVSKTARYYRFKQLLKGRYKSWNDINVKALLQAQSCLTAESNKILQRFIFARKSIPPLSLLQLQRSGVYRQGKADNLALMVASFLGKI